MKYAALFAFALLVGACHDEPAMTFGLEFSLSRSDWPAGEGNGWCVVPGTYNGNISGISLEIEGTPPHLLLEANPDAHEDVYRVRAYIAAERDEWGVLWEPSTIVAERTYDATFGATQGEDSFMIEFEGHQYTVVVHGIPASGDCS